MDANKQATIWKVKQLMEGDSLLHIINDIKQDIALSIVHTSFNQKDEREELYMLTKAFDALKVKLQEYVNTYDEIQENE